MNDDEKKPGVGENGADTPDDTSEQHDDVKLSATIDDIADDKNAKRDDESRDSGSKDFAASDEIDIAAALKDDTKDDAETTNEEPEEVSEEERELGRIEGIGAAGIPKPPASPAEQNSDELDDATRVTAPVDMEKEIAAPDDADNPLVAAIRKQEQAKDKPKKSNVGMVAGLLGVLLLVALGGAGYFYMQVAAVNDQLTSAQSELATAQAKSVTLESQLKKATTEQKTDTADTGYQTIENLGVRYKETDATKQLVVGYTAAPADASADAVAFSTKQLAKLTTGSGDSTMYPCAFTGNVPTLARYTTDVKIGTSTASKLGKKIGTAYYVYTAPTAACATTDVSAQTARDTAAKAIYDSLEAVPATTSTAATTTQK